MVKYYVRITDERPSDEDIAFWFELESGSDEKGEFFALRRNEFNDLVAKFNEVQQSYEEATANFEADVINSYVAPAVTTYMSGLDNVENSTNAIKLKDSSNSSKYHTYNSLENKFQNLKDDYDTKLAKKLNTTNVDTELSVNSRNPVQNLVITNELNNKVNNSEIDNLVTQLNGKSNSVHSHMNWTTASFSDYGTIYYNKELKLCFLDYYRTNVSLSSNEKVMHTIQYDKYKPIKSTKVITYNGNQGALVNASGEFKAYSTVDGKQNLNVNGFWICKGE